jgi:hypothetical protein
MKQKVLGWTECLEGHLPEVQRKKLIGLIEAVPDRWGMIHGDFHFKNVMMQDGEALLIDMDTISMGHPVFELANTYLAFVGFGELDPSVCEDFLEIPYGTECEIWKKFLRDYLGTDDEDALKNTEDKIRIVAYVRLMRHVIRRGEDQAGDGRRTVEYAARQLGELLDRTETLDF